MNTATSAPVLTMALIGVPVTCGTARCTHVMCQRWRERAKRRCMQCDRVIAPGQRFIEYRNEQTGDLCSLEHVTCPEGGA